MKTNNLKNAKSPYLLQHADNPVHWFEWGDEPFSLAREENKPVFLSIGYSSCHWCHVMEEESFSDQDVAELLNGHFISIKVDREERPDIDAVYMNAAQILSGGGGWPLSIFLTPDGEAFYSDTYIPKISRYGKTGLMELLPKISELWNSRKQDLINTGGQVNSILQSLGSSSGSAAGNKADVPVIDSAFELLKQEYDSEFGGFGSSQKFPCPDRLAFLLEYYRNYGNSTALDMAETTVYSIVSGGIYDHAGFGVHRYTVDRSWTVPHFEKMLYDQAMLLQILAGLYPLNADRFLMTIAEQLVEFVTTEMMSPDYLYYSAIDAGGTKDEGLYYTWSVSELKDILRSDFEFMERNFLLTEQGNYRGPHNVPHLNVLKWKKPPHILAEDRNVSIEKFFSEWNRIRIKLAQRRSKRVHPFIDDKILTDWNAMFINALARASAAFQKPEWSALAQKSMDSLLKIAGHDPRKLFHRFRDGIAGIDAFLDDYAYLVEALLTLHQVSAKQKYLDMAFACNEQLLTFFWDYDDGGFYQSREVRNSVLVRIRKIEDGPYPAGANTAFYNTVKLAKLSGNAQLLNTARTCLDAAAGSLSRFPHYLTSLLQGMLMLEKNSTEIIIVGNETTPGFAAMRKAALQSNLPGKIIAYIDPDQTVSEHLEYAKSFRLLDRNATAYVCRNFVCALPVDDMEALQRQLGQEP